MRHRKLGYSYAMVVTRSHPSSLLEALRTGRFEVVLSPTEWNPPTDIYESNQSIIIVVELAGVQDENADILIYQNALVVKGYRKLPPVEADVVFRSAEIRQGPFRVEVALPVAIDYDGVSTTYDRGILRIVMPKASER